MIPHACRFALGSDHRVLLPAATLAGGLLLLLADVAARRGPRRCSCRWA